MPADKSPPLDLIAVAAQMRVTGHTWAEVAAKVERAAERIRHWPYDYPNEWRCYFREAERIMLADVASEARQVLRRLLRSQNENVQFRAAQQALKIRETDRTRELPPRNNQISEQDEMIANQIRFINEMTDEELDHFRSESWVRVWEQTFREMTAEGSGAGV
jgi:hypothetical protein